MTLPLLAVGAVGLDRRRHPLGARPTSSRCSTSGSAGDAAGARGVNARLLESWPFETGDESPEPGPGQGDAAPPRPAGRALPPADGRRPGVARLAGCRRLRGVGRRSWLDLTSAAPRRSPSLTPSGSSSSAAWARSAATAWRSSRGPSATARRSILLIDCGLMFPGPDMHGIDLVLPDFTYLRENAARIVGLVATHGHEDHVGGAAVPAARGQRPDLRLGADARARPQPHRGGRPARAHRAARRRSTASACSIGPFDVEFIPVTHSVPHAHAIAVHTPPGRHPPLRRLQARPHAGRRPAHRPRPHRRARQDRRASACCWRLDQRRGGRPRAERDAASARVLRSLFAEHTRPADHHGQLRQPPPPHPADRRRRHRQRPQGGHARAEHAQERAARHRPRRPAHPGRARSSTSRTSTATRRARSA